MGHDATRARAIVRRAGAVKVAHPLLFLVLMSDVSRLMGAVVLATWMAACGGIADSGDGETGLPATAAERTGDDTGGDGRARTTPAPAPDAAATPPIASDAAAARAQLCASSPSGVRATPTREDFVAAMLGAWVSCGATSVFGTSEAGLELTEDGRWAKLVASPGAPELTRAKGWNDTGTWTVLDTSSFNGPGVFQLNLDIDGLGTVVTIPVFSTSSPDTMRLNNNGVWVSDYVRVPRQP